MHTSDKFYSTPHTHEQQKDTLSEITTVWDNFGYHFCTVQLLPIVSNPWQTRYADFPTFSEKQKDFWLGLRKLPLVFFQMSN